MFSGFRQFVARGNVLDLAVGVIIGAAFGAVVDSLVKDLITPFIGMIIGQPDFSAWKAGAVNIGNFIKRDHRLPVEGGRALLLHRAAVQPVRGEVPGPAAPGTDAERAAAHRHPRHA